jgi:hypothetical protein
VEELDDGQVGPYVGLQINAIVQWTRVPTVPFSFSFCIVARFWDPEPRSPDESRCGSSMIMGGSPWLVHVVCGCPESICASIPVSRFVVVAFCPF